MAPVVLLGVGFIISATALFAGVYFLGREVGIARIGLEIRLWVAAGLCAMLCLIDIRVVRRRRLCSIGRQRQTPKPLIERFGYHVGAFLWGLDTGLAVTTIRMVALTWAGLVLSLADIAPWWSGLAYGFGFTAPLTVAILGPRWRQSDGDATSDPGWIPRALMRRRLSLQTTCLIVLIILTALIIIDAVELAGAATSS